MKNPIIFGMAFLSLILNSRQVSATGCSASYTDKLKQLNECSSALKDGSKYFEYGAYCGSCLCGCAVCLAPKLISTFFVCSYGSNKLAQKAKKVAALQAKEAQDLKSAQLLLFGIENQEVSGNPFSFDLFTNDILELLANSFKIPTVQSVTPELTKILKESIIARISLNNNSGEYCKGGKFYTLDDIKKDILAHVSWEWIAQVLQSHLEMRKQELLGDEQSKQDHQIEIADTDSDSLALSPPKPNKSDAEIHVDTSYESNSENAPLINTDLNAMERGQAKNLLGQDEADSIATEGSDQTNSPYQKAEALGYVVSPFDLFPIPTQVHGNKIKKNN